MLPARLPRRAEPHPRFEAVLVPVCLELEALPVAQEYVLSSFWEERMAEGAVQRTSIEKAFQLSATQHKGHLVLRYDVAAPPTLRKPDPTALEKAVLLLADFYQHLELQISPDGQRLALLNHPEVRQTWERVRTRLVDRSGGEDAITKVLLDGVDEQLQRPESLLTSLHYDYFFDFLLKNIYQQRFESDQRYGQALVLPRFFASADLWCWERLELVPPRTPGRLALRLSGVLDRERTDVPAVVKQMLAALAAATDGGPVEILAVPQPTDLCFAYEAAYEVDALTGWPVSVEASVRCWLPAVYSKEYFLRFELAS